MRTTFLSQGRDLLLQLQITQQRRAEAGLQVASGLRVTKPSDSPHDASGVVRTRSEIARLSQFRDNLQSAQAELQAVDGSLASAGDAVNRALTLASQATSIVGDETTRTQIRNDLEGIFRGLLLVANTSHADRFLFSGDTTDTRPFQTDENSLTGVAYEGSQTSRQILFPDGQPGQISLPGDAIFARPDQFEGVGRTPGLSGSIAPLPPAAVGVAFSGDVEAVISADLDGYFVAPAGPGVALGGETISVTFVSSGGLINASITTAPLGGGESAADIAVALNTALAADPQLAAGFTFSDEGGSLKLVQSDSLGTGFTFSSSATGGLTSGLEAGGRTGGQSATEIAAALNAQVALNSELTTAGITFTAVEGEIQVDGAVNFKFTAIDFDRGTGFTSGLAGTHLVGGNSSANIFGSLHQLIEDLKTDDLSRIDQHIQGLRQGVGQIGAAQGFYGSTLRQIDATIRGLNELDVVNQQRLSGHRDADLVEAIGQLTLSSTAEQFTLQVLARQQPTLLDLLA